MVRNKSFSQTGGKLEALNFNNTAISKSEKIEEDLQEETVVGETEDVFAILNEGKKRKDNTVLKGFKIEKDIAKLIDKLGREIDVKRGGRGGNSKLVNQLLREGLEKRGKL